MVEKRKSGRPSILVAESESLSGEMWVEYAEGMTMREIGAKHGMSAAAVSKRLNQYRVALGEDSRAEARALDVGRIESLIDKHWQDAMDGLIEPTKLLINLIKLRASIYGYSEPHKVEFSGQVEHTVSADLASVLEALRERNEVMQGALTRVPAQDQDQGVEEAEVVDDDAD